MNRGPRRPLVAALVLALVALEGTVAASALSAPRRTFHGRYVVSHSDDFARGRATYRPSIELDDGSVLGLEFRGQTTPSFRPGVELEVDGSLAGEQIVVADGGAEQVGGASTAVAAGVTRSVAVVLLNFSNDNAEPYSPAYAEGVAFTDATSVAAYYAESSWGNLTLTGDVFGWYTIADDDTGCDYANWANLATTAANADGANLSSYDHVTFAFPSSSCGWAGLASLPGRNAWLNGSSAMGLRVFAHELGHNLGTHHASTLSCVIDGVRLSLLADLSGCTTNEYGDPFTVMGSASRYQQTNFSRGNAGWLTTANTQTVSATGEYTLAPIGTSLPDEVLSLRIERGTNSYLTLEFRQPNGFDNFDVGAPIVNGVTVRVAPDYATRTQSKLIDATPATATFTDAPLAAGQTLTDPAIGVSITTVSVDAGGATVRVEFGSDPPPDTTAPARPRKPKTSRGGPRAVTLNWAPVVDDTGVEGYVVFRGDRRVATVTGTRFRDRLPHAHMHVRYRIQAFDAAGNESRRSRAAHL